MAGVWTRNYTNALANLLGGGLATANSAGGNYATNNISVRNNNGSYVAIGGSINNAYVAVLPYMLNAYYMGGGGTISSGYVRLQCGNGTTPASYDDYALESPSSNFTLSQNNIEVSKFVYDAEGHTYSTTRRFVIQYTGSSPYDLSEFGLFMNCTYSSGVLCLLYHDVFEPITLNQYESVVIEMTQTFPLINYEPYPA